MLTLLQHRTGTRQHGADLVAHRSLTAVQPERLIDSHLRQLHSGVFDHSAFLIAIEALPGLAPEQASGKACRHQR
ncbi:hypothetical protein D3C86_1670020 [compost metagenome]